MIYFGQLLCGNARNNPNRLAVVSDRRQLTYEELNRESNRTANALRRRGVKKGDKLALLMNNSVEWVILWCACQKLGVVVVPLHGRLRPAEFVRIIELTACTVLAFDPSYTEAVNEISRRCRGLHGYVYTGTPEGPVPENVMLLSEGTDEREAQAQLKSDDPALILFTSGTTGNSKGVVRTQEMVVLHAVTLALANRSDRPAEVMMTTSPLYHTGGLLCMFKMMLMAGTLVLIDRLEPADVLRLIEAHQVTQLMILPPVTYERLYLFEGRDGYDLSSVQEVCVSAGKCTYENAMHIFEVFPNCHLRPSWGSTETCSVTGMQLHREELLKEPALINSVGRVNSFNEVRVVDKRGRDVPKGTMGEALVRSPMVFSGYIGAPELDEVPFTRDGWFKTGDLVRIDPDSDCLYFMDRKKDIIKTGGENVCALEIERVIQSNPAVLECAAVGVPDDRFGEAIGAAIVLRPGCSISPGELTEFCVTHLPNYKKPRYLAVLDKLPTNSVGKVQKTELRKDARSIFTPIA